MSELLFVFCDVCNENSRIIGQLGRGYIEGSSEKIAIETLGWERLPAGGIICLDCIDEGRLKDEQPKSPD